MKYKSLVRLMRPKHYLKNVLIFLPLLFSGMLFDGDTLSRAISGFVAFSLVASVVYIINDLNDRKLDQRHPKKKFRPIASGEVSASAAATMAVVLLLIAGVVQYYSNFSLLSVGLLVVYLLINILYSLGLKNIPIADVTILSLGFIIRVFYGADMIGVEVSNWLYLAVLAFSFYLSLGKRRNEIKAVGFFTRKVNRFYTQEFLDKNMYVCLGLTIMYYSLWAIDPTQSHKYMFLSVPVVLMIVMTYSLSIESAQSDGDPVNVVLRSKALLGLLAFYGVLMAGLVYL